MHDFALISKMSLKLEFK